MEPCLLGASPLQDTAVEPLVGLGLSEDPRPGVGEHPGWACLAPLV